MKEIPTEDGNRDFVWVRTGKRVIRNNDAFTYRCNYSLSLCMCDIR